MLWNTRLSLFTAFSFGVFALGSVNAQVSLDNPNSEANALMRMASNGYRIGSKTFTSLDDTDLLLDISTGKNGDLHELARLVLLRDVTLLKNEAVENRFGEQLSRAQDVISEGISNSAGRQSVAESLGDGIEVLDELHSIASDVGASPAKAMSAMTEQYRVARQGVVVEGLIGEATLRMLNNPQRARGKASSFRLRPTYSESSGRLFSSFRLANKTAVPISWAVVLLRVECEFSISDAEKNHTTVGQGLGRLFFGNAVPDYSAQLKAREAYGNTNKCAVYFVQNWQANRELEMVSLHADEYFSTATAASVEIVTAKQFHQFDVNVHRHRKLLKTNFDRPRTMRRR